MQKIVGTLGVIVILLALAQCSGNSSKDSKSICAAADVRACVGPGACAGEQICSGNGTQWSACVCKSTAADASPDTSAADTPGSVFEPHYVLIDDMESRPLTNGPIVLTIGGANLVSGYWGSWRSEGSPNNTMAPDPFAYASLTTPHPTMDGITSRTATHLACHIADLYGYCEESFWLAQDSSGGRTVDGGPSDVASRVSYDLSAHNGMVFWAMSSQRNRLKIMFNNVDTDVLGGKCGHGDASTAQCWDSFSKYVTLTDSWQRYEVKFSELLQEGWGYAAASVKLDPTSVYTIGFQVNGPMTTTAAPVEVDFWIDDVYFE